jgi:hypothetical protein
MTMDFQEFLREVKLEIRFLYPGNPHLGLAYFLTLNDVGNIDIAP